MLHPTVGCISFKRLMHPMMLKSQRVPTPFLVQHFMFRTGKGDEHFLLNPTEISVSLGHTLPKADLLLLFLSFSIIPSEII